MRDTTVFYKSFVDAIETQSKEIQAEIYHLVFDYAFNGTEPNQEEYNSVSIAMFMLMRPQIDANNKKYENGKKGGRTKAEPNDNQTVTKSKPKANQTETKTEPKSEKAEPNVECIMLNDNVECNNVNENVNVNDIKDVSSEPEETPTPEPTSPTVAEIVLNDKSKAKITQAEVDQWKKLYPAVDVLQELRKMTAWCEANPTKRKTKRGIKAFIVNWLSREQDKGKTGSTQQKPKQNAFCNYQQRTYDYAEIERRSRERLLSGGVSNG